MARRRRASKNTSKNLFTTAPLGRLDSYRKLHGPKRTSPSLVPESARAIYLLTPSSLLLVIGLKINMQIIRAPPKYMGKENADVWQKEYDDHSPLKQRGGEGQAPKITPKNISDPKNGRRAGYRKYTAHKRTRADTDIRYASRFSSPWGAIRLI